MSTNHTPGKWFVNEDHAAMSEYCICAESRGKGFGSSVAVVTQRDGEKALSHEEAMANARLIAAAPELLDALNSLLPDFKQYAYNVLHDDYIAVALATKLHDALIAKHDAALATIAKATGAES